MFPFMRFIYVSPAGLEIPEVLGQEIEARGVPQQQMTLDEAIRIADVLYVTRVQKERFTSEVQFNYMHTLSNKSPIFNYTINIYIFIILYLLYCYIYTS
jgi:aspartate carbamoyltransferase catalytic subunit